MATPLIDDVPGRGILRMSLICSICLEKLHKPRCLPCFHTFCETCLKNYIANSPEKKKAAKKGIPCPVCRLTTFAPKTGLPVQEWAEHFPLNQLVGTLIDIVPVHSKRDYCEPCKVAKKSKAAALWCPVCSETMCEECAGVHQSMKATRSHELKSLESKHAAAAAAKIERERRVSTSEFLCSEHTTKDIDMFCHDHKQPCCTTCVSVEHKKCEKIIPLSEALKEKHDIGDSKVILRDIDKINREADKIKKERMETIRHAQVQKTKLLLDVNEAKTKLMDHIARLESQIVTKFSTVSDSDFSILQEQIDYCNGVQKAMASAKTAIENAKVQKMEKGQFIAVHKAKNKVEECSAGLKGIQDNSAKMQYLFEEDKEVNDTVAALKALGTLDVKHSYPNREKPIPVMPPTPRPVTFIQEEKHKKLPPEKQKLFTTKRLKSFSARAKSDKRDCKITALKMWNNKKIFLIDNFNMKLKIFGEFGDVLSYYSCDTAPWDCTFIDNSKVVVTFPNERRIKFFSIKEQAINATGFIQTMRGCHGICSAEENIVVTYTTGCVRIMGLDGAVKMKIDTDYIGKRVFSNPEYVSFNPRNLRLYVSDYNNHSVTAFQYEAGGSVNNAPVFIYPVSGPRGVCVDEKGNLYICGFWSNDIHRVNDTGELKQIFLSSLARPLCIGFSDDGDKFAIAEQGNPNIVKILAVVPAEVDGGK